MHQDELQGKPKIFALTGLFLSMFVSMIAMNVVGTSMPIIIADLKGGQAAFTWVVTATMLASAISTPIWGKLADITNKKVLLQLSLIIFTLGSALAGLAGGPAWLIGFRVLQGLGAGGLGALGQIVMAEIISPRERGKYMGILGAIMAVSTVGGPLLGGLITDSIGWRWNFYVAVPIAVVAILFLQFTLHLHTEKRPIKIDYLGIIFISTGFSLLLIWVTLGGNQFEWWSCETLLMLGGSIILLGIALVVEFKASDPLIPMSLFKNRTFTLAVIGSLSVGIAMFGTAVFLSQYMQLARGKTPTESGLLTIPMMAGVLVASTVIGQLITKYGKWKAYVVSGAFLVLVGLIMMGQLRYDTSFWYVGFAMFVLGAGVGMTMQNLVLVTQNTVSPNEVGVASSGVTFFRTLGGTAGMSVMGAVLANQVAGYVLDGVKKLAPKDLAGAEALQGHQIPKLSDLSEPLRLVVEQAYGHGVGNIFLLVAPVALVTIITTAMLPNIPLKNESAAQQRAAAARRSGEGMSVAEAESVALLMTGEIPVQDADNTEQDPANTEQEKSGAKSN